MHFFSFSLAGSPTRDLQVTAYKLWSAYARYRLNVLLLQIICSSGVIVTTLWQIASLTCQQIIFKYENKFADRLTRWSNNKITTTETGRLFFRRRTKQLPLARKENVLGHVPKPTWAQSVALVARFYLRASSQSSIFGFRCWYNMVRIKVIVHVFPRIKNPSIFLRKSSPSPFDFWLTSRTCRNVITCAYLLYRPRGLNSNTFLDSSNCFARLRKNNLTVSVVLNPVIEKYRWSNHDISLNLVK